MATTHPDFGRIAGAVAEIDDLAHDVLTDVETVDEHHGQELFADLVDYEALRDAAMNRAIAILSSISPVRFLSSPQAAVAAAWTDAFLAGVRFQRSGGHTVPEQF